MIHPWVEYKARTTSRTSLSDEENENKQLEQTMTTSFKCSARECAWKTDELTQAMATEHLKSHHEANHGIHGAMRDKLQKLDRPVLMTGCSQQDFRFFKEE